MQLPGTLPAEPIVELWMQYPIPDALCWSANPGESIHVEPRKKCTSKIKSKATTRMEDKRKKDVKEINTRKMSKPWERKKYQTEPPQHTFHLSNIFQANKKT